MDAKIEHRVCIKFGMKLGKSAAETLDMLCDAFGEHSLSRTVVSELHSRFKVSQVSVEDDERSGPSITSKTPENVEKIQEPIHEDRRQTTFGIRYGVCHEPLKENLNIRHISAKFVPRLFDKSRGT
jgi:hypothetical protein